MLSGRDDEGSVEGGEKMASAAGVFGGRESRLISATWTGSGAGSIGTSGGVMVLAIGRRWRPRRVVLDSFFFSGFSCFSFSLIDDRCFFGDRTGSVLTGSKVVSLICACRRIRLTATENGPRRRCSP